MPREKKIPALNKQPVSSRHVMYLKLLGQKAGAHSWGPLKGRAESSTVSKGLLRWALHPKAIRNMMEEEGLRKCSLIKFEKQP